jgi:hypothetical protein
MKEKLFNVAVRKRKNATKYLYITTLAGCTFCIFAVSSMRSSINGHSALDHEADAAHQRYAFCRAFRQKSETFYAFCIYHAIYYHYHNRGAEKKDRTQSLKELRNLLELGSVDGRFIAGDITNDSFLTRYTSQEEQVFQYAHQMKLYFEDSSANKLADSLKLTTATRQQEKYSKQFLFSFLPAANDQLVNWIFDSEDFNPDIKYKYGTPVDNGPGNHLFTDQHPLIHEHQLAFSYYEADPSLDSLQNFLLHSYLTRANNLAFTQQTIQDATVSSASFYGINVKTGLLLFLIAPLITFFTIREFYLNQRINNVFRKPFSKNHLLLFNAKSIFSGANGGNELAFLTSALEIAIRICSVLLILFACFARYNYLPFESNPFQLMIENHFTSEMVIFDGISLLSLVVVMSLYNTHLQKKNRSRSLMNKIFLTASDILFCLSVIIVPLTALWLLVRLYPDYAQHEISTYAMIYIACFIGCCGFLYIKSRMNRQFAWGYIVLSLASLFYIMPSIIDFVSGTGTAHR